jgi:glycosyltransferase involved in cell wall biosynthesis
MEAMALGRPVLSTFVAGIPELVDSTCGWLVPAGDAEALANAMQQALTADPAQLAKMGQVGSQRVRERHDATKEAKKLFSRLACEPCLTVRPTEPLDTPSKLAG